MDLGFAMPPCGSFILSEPEQPPGVMNDER